MLNKPIWIVALLILAGCQNLGLNSNQSYTGACTDKPYDQGFCNTTPNMETGPRPIGTR